LLRRTHGRLDVEDLDVLPVLLQQRDKEVDGKLNVQGNLGFGHGDVGNCKGHAHNFLHLEFDGGLLGINLLLDVVVLIKEGREFTSLGKTRTKNTGDLLKESTRSKEGIILLGELLDDLLVLVELLQVLNGHAINTNLIGLLTMALRTQNANEKAWLGDDWKLEGTRETFVTLGIVVLQGDLERCEEEKL
jgi:hypothetical protein